MQRLPDGSLLVGATTGADYFAGTGSFVRFTGNDVATASSTVVSNISNPGQGVRLIGNDLIAVSQVGFNNGQISFHKIGSDPSQPYTHVGNIDFAGPVQFNMTMGTRPTPGQPGSYDLFFNTSSNENYQPSTGSVAVSGLTSGTVPLSVLKKVTVTSTGAAPTVSPVETIASGVRQFRRYRFRFVERPDVFH